MLAPITNLFTNNIFLTILLAGGASQLIKILIFKFKYKQGLHYKDLIVTGGMPSAHSALVGSLTAIIWLNEGFSALFFAVFTFSLIVLRDAIGVRRSVGEEGKVIQKIIRYEKIKINRFHYSLGHTPKQVVIGLIIGIASAIFSSAYF